MISRKMLQAIDSNTTDTNTFTTSPCGLLGQFSSRAYGSDSSTYNRPQIVCNTMEPFVFIITLFMVHDSTEKPQGKLN